MFKKEGLILNVLLAAVAGFFMNYAIYQLVEESSENVGVCGTSDFSIQNRERASADLPPENQLLYAMGEEIFNANCTQCHAINQKIVGPALKDVQDRWPDKKMLTQFIRYPQKVINSGKSPYAAQLYKKYQQYMPNHDFLDDEAIKALLVYIKHTETFDRAVPSAVAMQ